MGPKGKRMLQCNVRRYEFRKTERLALLLFLQRTYAHYA
jgi:hypothetical protein